MDKYRRLEDIVETNFRLSAMQSRELGAEMRRRMERQSLEFQRKVDELGRFVRTSYSEMGAYFENGMNEQADRMDRVVEVIRHIGDRSVDVNKELDDLKRRVKEFEDRAS